MNNIMSLLACICIVWVFVEFQSLVDGHGTSFVEESFVRRLRKHAATATAWKLSGKPAIIDRCYVVGRWCWLLTWGRIGWAGGPLPYQLKLERVIEVDHLQACIRRNARFCQAMSWYRGMLHCSDSLSSDGNGCRTEAAGYCWVG